MALVIQFTIAIILAVLIVNVKCIDYNPAASVVRDSFEQNINWF